MKEICFCMWIVVFFCRFASSFTYPMYSDDSLEPQDHLDQKYVLVKLLQSLTTDDESPYSRSLHSSDLDSMAQRTPKENFLTDNSMEDSFLLPSKRDMGVLPPWNEFCRMMRIAHCFHSRQS